MPRPAPIAIDGPPAGLGAGAGVDRADAELNASGVEAERTGEAIAWLLDGDTLVDGSIDGRVAESLRELAKVSVDVVGGMGNVAAIASIGSWNASVKRRSRPRTRAKAST